MRFYDFRLSSALAGLGVLAGLLAVNSTAQAFCRTTTEPIPADYDARAEGCWTSGKALFWANHCVGYSMNQRASSQVTLDDATRGLSDAFARWSDATCANGKHPSIEAVDEGPVACDDV